MLFLVSNAKTYPGFTELASLARKYIYSHLSLGVCFIFRCFAYLWMLCLVSNGKTHPDFTELRELASPAKSYLMTFVVMCLIYFGMLKLSLDAILAFEC